MGNVLLSHTLARAVPSGLRGLTTVFGMGTGGALALVSPERVANSFEDALDGRNEVMSGRLQVGAEELLSMGEHPRVHFMVKPNGRLVTVSFTHYCASTSVLST